MRLLLKKIDLKTRLRVITALMLRDPVAKHGHENLGFFWVIGEPLLLTTGVMSIWSAIGANHGHDISIAVFALTGYSFITLWRHIVFRSIRAMSGSVNLIYHRQIRRSDIIIAWAAIETVGVMSGFVISATVIGLIGLADYMHDPLLTLGGLYLGAWFSFSVGMLLAGLSEISEGVSHIVQPVMYLSLPLTGIFTMVDWLPKKVQTVMLYSPLVNCIEMIRSGIMPTEVETHFSVTYIIMSCIVVTLVAIPVFRYGQRFVQT